MRWAVVLLAVCCVALEERCVSHECIVQSTADVVRLDGTVMVRGELRLTRPLVLHGDGHTLQLDHHNSALIVESSFVSVRNLTMHCDVSMRGIEVRSPLAAYAVYGGAKDGDAADTTLRSLVAQVAFSDITVIECPHSLNFVAPGHYAHVRVFDVVGAAPVRADTTARIDDCTWAGAERRHAPLIESLGCTLDAPQSLDVRPPPPLADVVQRFIALQSDSDSSSWLLAAQPNFVDVGEFAPPPPPPPHIAVQAVLPAGGADASPSSNLASTTTTTTSHPHAQPTVIALWLVLLVIAVVLVGVTVVSISRRSAMRTTPSDDSDTMYVDEADVWAYSAEIPVMTQRRRVMPTPVARPTTNALVQPLRRRQTTKAHN